MKETAYIETTIVSYPVARPSRELIAAAHQQQDLRPERVSSSADERCHRVVGEVALERVPAFDLAPPAWEFQVDKGAQTTEEMVADGSLPAHEELRGSTDLLDGAVLALDTPVLPRHAPERAQGNFHALFFVGRTVRSGSRRCFDRPF